MYEIASADTTGDIHIKQPWHHTDFDEWKFNVESEIEANEDIKELDWEETHRQWDDHYETWVIDLDAMWQAIDHLSNCGYQVTIDRDVLMAYREEVANEQDL